MRMILVLLFVALVALQYKLWKGDRGILAWIELDKKHAAQKIENKKLRARNHAVEAEITELKSGEQALEEQARYELGMIHKGEVYYQFID